VTAAPPKKKGTIKAKIAEKEAAKAAQNDRSENDIYDEDSVLDPRAKALKEREREIAEDLNNTTDLLGAAALGGIVCSSTSLWPIWLVSGTTNKELDALISASPRTKEDFVALSQRIIEFIIKKHQDKPLYAAFVEHHVRELAAPLRDVDVRKAASGLTTLANEKQKAQREAASGKKKTKAAVKPGLGSSKVVGK
jgi:translation initiation factor 3 subunit J